MTKKFVEVKGKKYYASNLMSGEFGLDLSFKEITNITEIKGLDDLTL